jgi:hypothetical protein
MKKIFTTFCFTMIAFCLMAQVNLTNGLVAYYPFNGSANDVSGNGLNATVVGAALTTDSLGNPNSAYSFNGTSDYIYVPDNALLRPGNLSLSVWVNTSDNNSSFATPMIYKGDRTDTNNAQYGLLFGFGLLSGEVKLANCNIWWDSTNDCGTADTSFYNDNEWHHYVLTYDGSMLTIYADGQFRTDTIGPGGNILNCAGGDLNIGIIPEAVTFGGTTFVDNVYFMGKMDELRIYNRALNSSEVSALYNGSVTSVKLNII